jgi:hypothetical protein
MAVRESLVTVVTGIGWASHISTPNIYPAYHKLAKNFVCKKDGMTAG